MCRWQSNRHGTDSSCAHWSSTLQDCDIPVTRFLPALDSVSDWRTWGPAAMETVLWMVLAVNGARLAWLLLVSPAPLETVHMPSVASAPATFSAVDPFYPDAGVSTGDARALLVGYTLHGVRNANGEAGAIIADANGRQRAFLVGDTLAPGVVLHAVGTAHAVLVAAGNRHRLELPPARDALAVTPDPAGVAARGAQAPTATIVPATATTGLRVDDHPALRLVGLEPGDLLVSVDGHPPSPEWLATIARDGAETGAALTVRRGGRTLTLVVGPVLR